MECVHAASLLGFGFRKGAQHLLFLPETVKALSADVSPSGDEFFADQLLNLNADDSHEENSLAGDGEGDLREVETHRRKDDGSGFLSLPEPASTAGEDGFHSLITLPEEEPDLEWLSQFVEDSFSQFNHAAGVAQPAKVPPETPLKPSSFSPPAVLPRSRRSKRLRSAFPATGRFWALSAQPVAPPSMSTSLTESTTTSSSPSSSATSSPHWATSPTTPLALPGPNKKNKVWAGVTGPSGRRCSHCGAQKTPQWRAGPMGAKTLCNACGVRFKSGRLLPEYRPACSPTFSSELHSNSHRKVLEMRRSKDGPGQPEPGFVSVADKPV